MGFEVEATIPVTMADLVQARADYDNNSAPGTDSEPGMDTAMETDTGIDSEPDAADERADELAARAYQILLAELFEAKHCEMCDENDCTADNPMYECDTCHRMHDAQSPPDKLCGRPLPQSNGFGCHTASLDRCL